MKICIEGIEFRVFYNKEIDYNNAIVVDSCKHDEDKLGVIINKIERDFAINVII